MGAGKYSVYNPTRESHLSAGVTVIDTTLEPLKVLKVMIEGLALNAETGLWLTPLDGIPKVPRLSPFDLIYLDNDGRVVQGAELLPGVDFPAFNGKAASALVLPYKTISASQTRSGDQLLLDVTEEIENPAETDSASTAAVEPGEDVEAQYPLEESEVAATPKEDSVIPEQAEAEPLGEVEAMEEGEFEIQDDESVITEALRWAEETKYHPEPITRPAAPAAKSEEPLAAKSEKRIDEPPSAETSAAPAKREDAPKRRQIAKPPVDEPVQAEPAAPKKELLKDPLWRASKKPAPEPEPPPVSTAPVPVRPIAESAAKRPAKKIDEVPEQAAQEPLKWEPVRPVVAQRTSAKERADAVAAKKESTVKRALRWLFPEIVPPIDRRGSFRRPVQELVAYHSAGGTPQAYLIGDISSTGVYLVTRDRLPADTLISLTVQRKGPPEESSERKLGIKAEAVRWGHEGVGLRFVLPTGMDLRLWETPYAGGADGGAQENVLDEIRMAKTLFFVRRICPPVSEGVTQLLTKELSNFRMASAVEIALKAEQMLDQEPDADGMRAHPAIVLRILEGGSWADLELVRLYWAGLLATACTMEGNDESNLAFVDMLSLLTPIHVRILADACTRATKFTSEQGVVSSYPLYCTAKELVRIAGTTDLTKIHRSIAQMADLGLFEKSARSSFISYNERAKTTPTSLGLQMFARCNGHREVPKHL